MVVQNAATLATAPVVAATSDARSVTSHTLSLSSGGFALSYTYRREENHPQISTPAQARAAPNSAGKASPFSVQGPHEARRRLQLARLLCPPLTPASPEPTPPAEPAPTLAAGPACRAYQQAASQPLRGSRLYKA